MRTLLLLLVPLVLFPTTSEAERAVKPRKEQPMRQPPVKLPAYHFPPRPVPTGETFELEQKASHTTKSGLVVRYAHHSHKHAAKGHRDAQMLFLELSRGERHEEIELRTSDDILEAELDALGSLLVVTGGYSSITVVVAAEKTPSPLTSDEARELLEEAAARRKLEKNGSGSSVENGLLHLTAQVEGRPAWRGRVGLWTRRVWFLEPDETDGAQSR